MTSANASPAQTLNLSDGIGGPDSLIEFQTASVTPPEVARMWMEDGQLKFEGNADVAAQALFDMLRVTIDEYVAERIAKSEE